LPKRVAYQKANLTTLALSLDTYLFWAQPVPFFAFLFNARRIFQRYKNRGAQFFAPNPFSHANYHSLGARNEKKTNERLSAACIRSIKTTGKTLPLSQYDAATNLG
jgi:hypothetical protein